MPPCGTITSAWRLLGSMNCSWLGRTVPRYWSITLWTGALPLGHVALEAADEAHVGIGVDEDPQVEPLPQLRLVEHEDALDHHHPGRRDHHSIAPALVGGEVVDRHLHLEPCWRASTWSSSSGQSKASGWS